jgi:hypothetical protein
MTKHEIEQTLRDYHWMIREIERLRELLGDAGERIVQNFEVLGMPKAKGGRSDPVALEASRRERHWKKLRAYERKVMYVQERLDIIQDERERTVLDCMLDGMSMRAIAHHMGLSRRHIQNMKDSIVEQFYTCSDRAAS